MKRVSRACLHCRQRKSRCDLDSSGSPGTPPCQRCLRDNRECVLGGSNRGGRRIRKNRMGNNANGASIDTTNAKTSPLKSASATKESNGGGGADDTARQEDASSSLGTFRRPSDTFTQPELSSSSHVLEMDDDTVSSVDSNIDNVPQNPSDAWQYLAHVAKWDSSGQDAAAAETFPASGGNLVSNNTLGNGISNRPQGGILAYPLVRDALLSTDMVTMLVARFRENYHDYLSLVPRLYFEPNTVDAFASNAKHLLTAVLTIASKDLVEVPHVHEHCSKYMHELISGIAAGSDCDVEAVEALLLLAEWEPQGLRQRIEAVGRGEEDRAAWMHVGLALRSGYFLGLDRTSFRDDTPEDPQSDARRRLAWACCYVSDRLISVRIGRAFWSRGPGPMTGLSSQDFPSLQPVRPGDENYAKIFQATLDMTQLYGNVHEVLYSGMRTSGQMMLMGDYVKYVDDFRAAISRWNRIWGTLTCSPHIKITLQMSYEYLRLYTNAFAFQAAISQALSSKPKGDAHSQREHLRAAFSDVASMPDARFIYESMDAAKSYLTMLNNFVDPEKYLRYMPLRFYLYSIYSAVFLYKARSFGVMNAQEESGVRQMIMGTMDRLRRASVSPQDLGSRYARLLELLWQKPKPPASTTSQDTAARNNDMQLSGFSTRASDPGYMQFSPANDFSWLDLEAVGDYVSGDQITSANLLSMDPLAGTSAFSPTQDRTSWQPNTWPVDLNGNLLF